MRVTKYTHSCILVEEDKKTMLFDPGNYSYQDFGNRILQLPKIDFIFITHSHEDHCYVPFIDAIYKKFPNVKIVANDDVLANLPQLKTNVQVENVEWVEKIQVPHEEPLVTPPPQNTLFKIFNRFIHPGDSLSYEEKTEILAMPIQGSWGSMVDCLKHAIKIKPKKVIPIHDWHWNDKAREWSYEKATDYLKPFNIEFINVKEAMTFEI